MFSLDKGRLGIPNLVCLPQYGEICQANALTTVLARSGSGQCSNRARWFHHSSTNITPRVSHSQASVPLMAGMQVSAETRHFLFNLRDTQHSHMVPKEPTACPAIRERLRISGYQSVTAWSHVNRDTLIPYDLKRDPLQIKTDSAAGSKEEIVVRTYTGAGIKIGTVKVKFTSPFQYYIGWCNTSWPELPVQPPEEVDKVWKIRKNTTTLSIKCNGVEVLNYQFSDSSGTSCVSTWKKDVMKIQFVLHHDTASDSYVEKPTKTGIQQQLKSMATASRDV
eukprot:sb/3467936/